MNNTGSMRPFHAFSGSGRYVSVNYSPADSAVVFEILERLYTAGYNLWYDEGREHSDVYEMEELMADKGCELLAVFISPSSVKSDSEVMSRLERVRGVLRKPVIYISPDSFNMPDGMELFFQGNKMITGDLDEVVSGIRAAIPVVCRGAAQREPDRFELTDGVVAPEAPEADEKDEPREQPAPAPAPAARLLPRHGDEPFEYMYSGDTGLTLVRYTGDDESLVMDELRDGYPVTRIGDQAFRGRTRLARLRLPASISFIGQTAFRDCKALTDVVIPGRVTAIGAGAFYGCAALTKLILPPSVTDIGDMAFRGCSALSRVTIPDSVKRIGDNAFRDCMLLIIECTEESFAQWYAMRNNIPFRIISKDTMRERCRAAAEDDPSQKRVGTPLNAATFKPHAADTAYNGYSVSAARRGSGSDISSAGAGFSPVIENKTGNYAYFCFDDNDYHELRPLIADVMRGGCDVCRCPDPKLGDSVYRTIEDSIKQCRVFVLFLSHSAVQSGRVMDAELDCALRRVRDRILIIRLDDARIPDTLPQVGGGNIINKLLLTYDELKTALLARLNEAGCGADELVPHGAPHYSTGDFDYVVDSSGAVIVGYRGHERKLEIPARIGGYGVAALGNRVFEDNTELTEVIIPPSVTAMGVEIFKGCKRLERITLPPSITKIGYGSFRDCESLREISLPSTVTEIGWHAFSGCRALAAMAIPVRVTKIESWAFDGCISLGRISIPESVVKIDVNAFFNCSKRLTVIAPKDSYAHKFALKNGYKWKRVR